jgi:hypothetical protein
VATSRWTPPATDARIADPRLTASGTAVTAIGRFETSAWVCIQRSLLSAPPEATTSVTRWSCFANVRKTFSVPKQTASMIAR